jgi:hypothetical protein
LLQETIDLFREDYSTADEFLLELFEYACGDVHGIARTGNFDRSVAMGNGDSKLVADFSQMVVLGTKKLDG